MSTLKPFYQDRNNQAGNVQKTGEAPNIVFPAVLACPFMRIALENARRNQDVVWERTSSRSHRKCGRKLKGHGEKKARKYPCDARTTSPSTTLPGG